MTARRAIVIGGGISGLATANLLAHDGWQVTVLEQRHQLGGRAGLLKAEGFTFDTGPSWYLMTEVFDRYYSLLGYKTGDLLDLVRLDPAYRVFSPERAPITIQSDVEAAAATFESLESDAGQKLRKYLQRAEAMYDLALNQFLYTNFEKPASLINPGLLKHLSLIPRSRSLHVYVAKQFKHPVLRQILEYPGVFLGVSPYKAPALYSLMSHLDIKQGVYYPRGGMYEIIKSMEKIGTDLGVSYRLNTEVTGIDVDDSRAKSISLVSGDTLQADLVISAADLFHTEHSLLQPQQRTYSEAFWKKAQPGPSALLLYLGIKGRLPQLVHHNLIFTSDWRSNFADVFGGSKWPYPASMYVSAPSRTDPSVAPTGQENLFVLVPLPAAVTHNEAEQTRHIEQYLDQLAVAINAPDLRSRIIVQKSFGPSEFAEQLNAWQGGALGLGHTWMQSAMFRPGIRSKKVSNLFYVGTNVRPGVGLPMCLISSELVRDAVKATQ